MKPTTNTTDAAVAKQPADSTATIECHENRISGKSVDYTARAWYVRRDGKLHGQFLTENEAVSFAAALDGPPASAIAAN